MSSPSPSLSSKRSPSPTPKKSLRNRMGTIVRRGSSFLRPTTPGPRSNSEDPLVPSGVSTPPRTVSSKPASVHSAENASTGFPFVLPPEKSEERKEDDIPPAKAPAASVEPPSAEPEREPEQPMAELISEPAAQPAVEESRFVEAEKPVEESHAPTYVPMDAAPIESKPVEDSRPESDHEYEPTHEEIRMPFHDSPTSLAASLPRESPEHHDVIVSDHSTTEASSDSPNHPVSLSVKTSHENLRTDLSPIIEDERSALEERKMPFAQRDGLPPSGLSAPPIVAPTLSEMSGGTTPRAMPAPLVAAEDIRPHFAEEKGKEREANGSAFPTVEGLPQDGYFSRSVPMPVPNVPNEHYYMEDPFKDPEPASVSTTQYDSIPEPDTRGYDTFEEHATAEPSLPAPEAQPLPIVYPLPPLNEVTSKNLRTVPSDYTLGAQSSRAPSAHHEVETDETLPLLSGLKNPATDSLGTHHRDFQNDGWIAYSLPDSTTYYFNPRIRMTTDINMHDPRKSAAVTRYLDKKLSKEMSFPVEDLEIWLHDEGTSRDDFVPVRCWVDHNARALGYWPPPTNRSETATHTYADDRLDFEYRYWAFMETHPAHVPLPHNAYSEALDKLTWSYTDRLLKSNRRAPPPFTQHESQELIGILRSTSGSESSVQAAVQTRVVARILRRIVQWKQHFFRPEKPLPRGTDAAHQRERPAAHRRTFLDFIVAWLCLGIPYLYANRHVYRFDEESGLIKSAGPVLVVGATICIVAATILVASLTFLALPGLDQVSRTAGFIAILGSFASLGASVIAAFRNHVEVQRMAARGGEGLVVSMTTVTGGSVLPALPAVFLVWAVLSLVTGVVLYAFRGSVGTDPSHWTRFASFTRWTTVGVLGFCGGVLIASMVSIRR